MHTTYENLRKERTLNNYTIKSNALGFLRNGSASVISISGHFSAGKSIFYDLLKRRMSALDSQVEGVINYKMRGPRPTEILGVDYILVDSDEKYEELVNSGSIVVPYVHDGLKYGLNKDFIDVLKNGRIPLMITDESGLNRLIEYLEAQKLPNKVISFMLHTNKDDAKSRLFVRASKYLSEDEVKGIRSHMEGLDEEFERYRTHEDLFCHVLKNNTIEGVDKDERIYHLTTRAMQILDLEGILDKEKTEDFREDYVDYVVEKLFGTKSTKDLVGSMDQGVQLSIPNEIIDMYSHEQGISPSIIRKAVSRDIFGAINHYGILTIYLEPTIESHDKKFLADLIEEAVGLEHQHKKTNLSFSEISEFGLKQVADRQGNLTDFIISFSSYDPMRTPPRESRIHTIAFESLMYKRPQHIIPVSYTQAHNFIEGDGSKPV